MMFRLFLVFAFLSSTFADLDPYEKLVLKDLFDDTQGNKWIAKTNWNVGDPCKNDWWGITCDDNGTHVVTIDLTNNNLVGNLPPTMSQLSELQRLYMGVNTLTGPLEPLCGLLKLIVATLPANKFDGEVPSCIIGLQELQSLDLENNQLTGNLYPFFQLPKLKTLDLSGNQITGTIPPFNKMVDVSFFDIGCNHIEGTIPPMHHLSDLVFVNMSNNKLYGLVPMVNPYVEGHLDGNVFECPLPQYLPKSVDVTCSYCQPGFSLQRLTMECVECPPGYYSDGVSGCLACHRNSYAPTARMSECGLCPSGTWAPEGSGQCFGSASNSALTILVLFLVFGILAAIFYGMWRVFLHKPLGALWARIRGRMGGRAPVTASEPDRKATEQQPIFGSYGAIGTNSA